MALALLVAALPPAASLYADSVDPGAKSLIGVVGQHCGLAAFVGAVVGLFALLLLEPPERPSLPSYVTQLRAHLSAIEARVDEPKKS